jgi:hypothetical protein
MMKTEKYFLLICDGGTIQRLSEVLASLAGLGGSGERIVRELLDAEAEMKREE